MAQGRNLKKAARTAVRGRAAPQSFQTEGHQAIPARSLSRLSPVARPEQCSTAFALDSNLRADSTMKPFMIIPPNAPLVMPGHGRQRKHTKRITDLTSFSLQSRFRRREAQSPTLQDVLLNKRLSAVPAGATFDQIINTCRSQLDCLAESTQSPDSTTPSPSTTPERRRWHETAKMRPEIRRQSAAAVRCHSGTKHQLDPNSTCEKSFSMAVITPAIAVNRLFSDVFQPALTPSSNGHSAMSLQLQTVRHFHLMITVDRPPSSVLLSVNQASTQQSRTSAQAQSENGSCSIPQLPGGIPII